MISNPRRGAADLLLIGLIAVVAIGGTILLKPLFSGDKRRADASREATEQLIAATNAQGASAAASVAKIGEANTMAPDSPARNFITREVPTALAKLPPPDPQALLEAERRRSAVMEGRLEEANRLYQVESKRAAKLQEERDTAIAERRAVDDRLAEVAAARAAAERQRMLFLLGMGLLGALFVAAWFFRISPGSVGRIIADVRGGDPLTTAFDAHTTPLLQRLINRSARLATPVKDPAATATTKP